MPASFRSTLIATIASAPFAALAVANSTAAEAIPLALNEPAIFSDQNTPAVFQLARTWRELPAGTRMVGTPHVANSTLSVCIETVRIPGTLPMHISPGHCFARAVPAPEADVERRPDGTLVVRQAQPFYLYDVSAELAGVGAP